MKGSIFMIRTVTDSVTNTEFFVTNISLLDERPLEDGITTYEVDLVSSDGDITIFNAPLTYEDGNYAIADISQVIDMINTYNLDTYDYHIEKQTQVYDCLVSNSGDNIISTGSTYTEPHSTVSIYQANKEPLTQEATTIPDLIEILEYAQTLDYTEIVISGAFTKGIKRSK